MRTPSPLLLFFVLLILGGTLLPSCVGKKKYLAEVSERQRQDSLRKARVADVNYLEGRIKGLRQDTTALNDSLDYWQSRYNTLVNNSLERQEMLSSELQAKNESLQKKEQLLQTYSSELEARAARVEELEAIIRRQDSITQALLSKVEDALIGFTEDELSVEMRDGKVYVSVSEQLLFSSGSIVVNQKGQEALAKVAEVLARNPDIQVMIEGHTDSVPISSQRGAIKDNWDLSVLRATSVVRIIRKEADLAPERITAAGRGPFVPVASNATPEGKAQNRRTEIILTPKLDELFSLLSGEK